MAKPPVMFGMLLERGHVPDEVPPELALSVALLPAYRFVAGLTSDDGAIACTVAALDLETVLAPCVALLAVLATEAQWCVFVGPAGQGAIAKLARAA